MQCDCIRRVQRGRKCTSRMSQASAKPTASRRRARRVAHNPTLIGKDSAAYRRAHEHRAEQQCCYKPSRVLLCGRVARSPSPKEFQTTAHSHIAREFVRWNRAARHIAREFVRCTCAAHHVSSFRNCARAAVKGPSDRVHSQSHSRAVCTNFGNCAHRVAHRAELHRPARDMLFT